MTPLCCWKAVFCFITMFCLGALGQFEGGKDDNPPSKPTEVKLGIFLVDLIEVNGAKQTFTADFLVKLSWNDPRLASPNTGERRFAKEDIWFPQFLVANLRSSDSRWPEEVTVSEDGEVVYRQRSIGTFACPLDLKKFPHDRQNLFVQILGVGLGPEDLVFQVDESVTGTSSEFTITDWEADQFGLTAGTQVVPSLGVEMPSFRLDFRVTRLSRYYVGTIFATVAIIALMAWLVYWLPIGALPPRVSVSVTSMLALIAYRFVAAQDLPKLPYLTSMDHFLLGAAVLILLGLATVVMVANQDGRGNHDLARRLNLVFRWAYPLILAGLLITLGTD